MSTRPRDRLRTSLRLEGPQSLGCVVLDMAMPGLDGLEIQQKLVEGGAAAPDCFSLGARRCPGEREGDEAGGRRFPDQARGRGGPIGGGKSGHRKSPEHAAKRAPEQAEIERRLSRLSASRASGPRPGRRGPAQQADRRRPGHRGKNDQGPPRPRDGKDESSLGGGACAACRAGRCPVCHVVPRHD